MLEGESFDSYRYAIKQSYGEAPVILELWGGEYLFIVNTPRLAAPDRFLFMVHIELFDM